MCEANLDIDSAALYVGQLEEFLNLLAHDDVAVAFGGMDGMDQTAIFGALAGLAANAYTALTEGGASHE